MEKVNANPFLSLLTIGQASRLEKDGSRRLEAVTAQLDSVISRLAAVEAKLCEAAGGMTSAYAGLKGTHVAKLHAGTLHELREQLVALTREARAMSLETGSHTIEETEPEGYKAPLYGAMDCGFSMVEIGELLSETFQEPHKISSPSAKIAALGYVLGSLGERLLNQTNDIALWAERQTDQKQ